MPYSCPLHARGSRACELDELALGAEARGRAIARASICAAGVNRFRCGLSHDHVDASMDCLACYLKLFHMAILVCQRAHVPWSRIGMLAFGYERVWR